MTPRGRTSAAALAVVSANGAPLSRLGAPHYLTPEEKALWAEIVDTKPAEWFGLDSAPVLVEYVRAVGTCNLLAGPVAATLAEGDPKAIKEILTVRDRESKRAADLATKLRLTQQSRYTPQAAATADRNTRNGRKPWAAA